MLDIGQIRLDLFLHGQTFLQLKAFRSLFFSLSKRAAFPSHFGGLAARL